MIGVPPLSRESLALLSGLVAVPLVLAAATTGLSVLRADQNAERIRLESILTEQAKELGALGVPSGIAGSSPFLSEGDTGLAAARLQKRLAAAASASGMTVTSIEVLPIEGSSTPNAVRVGVNLSGPVAGLQGFLLDIETGLPVLFVGAADLDAATPNTINARVIVEGFLQPLGTQ